MPMVIGAALAVLIGLLLLSVLPPGPGHDYRDEWKEHLPTPKDEQREHPNGCITNKHSCYSVIAQARPQTEVDGVVWIMAVYRNGDLVWAQTFNTLQACNAACAVEKALPRTTCLCGPRVIYKR